MLMTKYVSKYSAPARLALISWSNEKTKPRSMSTATMQTRSTNHAKNRVTGPASNCENTMPSGVRIWSVLVLISARRELTWSANLLAPKGQNNTAQGDALG